MADIKSFPFPVMSDESLDYLNSGGEYITEVTLREDKNEVIITHKLRGDNTVSRLIKENKARFACIVVLPSTMYRQIHLGESSSTDCSQNIDLSKAGYYREMTHNLPLFRPIILAKEKIEKIVGNEDGLFDQFWKGQNISIPKGSIIAYGSWEHFVGGSGGILRVEHDPCLKNGEMRVKDILTANGFKFLVRVGGKNLYNNLDSSSSKKHRMSVLTHALSAGFRILKEEYKEEEKWKDCLDLHAVKEILVREDLGHWSDDDFDPEQTATILYPHIFEDETDYDD